jgi:hypothetical protein
VGPRAGLDTEARGKILCPCRGSNPDRPAVQNEELYLLSPKRLHGVWWDSFYYARPKKNKFWRELIRLVSIYMSFI